MLTKTDLKSIRNIVEVVVDEVLDSKLDEKLDPIHNKIDKVIKIASDTRQEQVVSQTKVDDHETRIVDLQKFVGIATA